MLWWEVWPVAMYFIPTRRASSSFLFSSPFEGNFEWENERIKLNKSQNVSTGILSAHPRSAWKFLGHPGVVIQLCTLPGKEVYSPQVMVLLGPLRILLWDTHSSQGRPSPTTRLTPHSEGLHRVEVGKTCSPCACYRSWRPEAPFLVNCFLTCLVS